MCKCVALCQCVCVCVCVFVWCAICGVFTEIRTWAVVTAVN